MLHCPMRRDHPDGCGRRHWTPTRCLFGFLLLFIVPTADNRNGLASAKAILGVDFGSLYMKVALVQSGSPIQVVTNLHSKRKTEQMILFDKKTGQRFYGADASSLLARKSQFTPAAMSILLGRDDDHPIVRVLGERHYPLRPVFNESRFGSVLIVDGHEYAPEELVAMVLQHAIEISVAYSASTGVAETPKDLVLTVPAFATQSERLSLLAAAALADLNVLQLLEENTAAALQYAMDKTFEDGEQVLLFYNLGASSLQVSVVKFESCLQPQRFGKPKKAPCLTILAKAWDATLGGQAFDHLLVEYLADQFNHQWNHHAPTETKDVRTVPRAMTKLRLQASKIKHVLSANTEIPVYMESLHDDMSLSTHITRDQLEDMAEKSGLLDRAVEPVRSCLAAANMTIANLTGSELIGGGMRVPAVQAALRKFLDGDDKEGAVELGLHMNADESACTGAAFAGANVSTAFRVRHVGLTDVNPFPMTVTLTNLEKDDDGDKKGGGLFGLGKKKEEAADKDGDEDEKAWTKSATIFKAFGRLGVKKTIAFTHDRDVHCALDYAEVPDGADPATSLPEGTETALERFNLTGIEEFAKEMAEKGLGKPKISLQFELSSSGVTSLVKAEAACEEKYTVQEEIEVDDDDDDDTNTTDADAVENETNATADAKEEEDKDGDKEKGDDKETQGAETDAANDTAAAGDSNETDAAGGEDDANKTKAKKKKKITVDKEKKRTHRRALETKTYHVGKVRPMSPELFEASRQKLKDMAAKDKERTMLEESRNKVESYMYFIKNKLVDDEEHINKVSTEEQREACRKASEGAEEWLDDEGYKADYATMEDKYAELSQPFEKILLRVREASKRPEVLLKAQQRLTNITELVKKWETTKPQITEDDRQGVLDKVDEIKAWIEEKEAAQKELEPHEDPAFLTSEVAPQFKLVEALVKVLSKKPKPKEKKNATATNATNATADDIGGAANSTEAPEGDGDKTEEPAKEEAFDDEAFDDEDDKKEDTQEGEGSKEGEDEVKDNAEAGGEDEL